MFDPSVLISKAVLMQRIQLAVAKGYVNWISGVVPASRALALADKFHERYALAISKHSRHRRRRSGAASSQLFLYPIDDTTSLRWWLVRTESNDQERWSDARIRGSRLRWSDEYELLRLTVPRELQKRYRETGHNVNPQTWTWRMTERNLETWKQRSGIALAQIQTNPQLFRQLIWSLDRAPGFRGVRDQVFELRGLIGRLHEQQTGHPYVWAKGIPWMSARRSRSYPLSQIVAQVGSEGTWWPGG